MVNEILQTKSNNESLAEYHCPRYEELPKIDVYMDQLIALLDVYLSPFQTLGEDTAITATMVNNYVKQKVIMPPKNKKYSRRHIMYLIVLGTLKNVLSISDIAALIKMQIGQFSLGKSFNFFAIELENALSKLVRSALLSFANKVYVKKNIRYNDSIKNKFFN